MNERVHSICTLPNVIYTSINFSWLVGCFGFNDPLRQYFSLYRAVFQREGKIGEKDRGE